MLPETKAKTQETCATYARIAQVVLRHADRLRERGDLGGVTDQNLAMALAWQARLPNVQPATARLYRAAVLFAIEQQPGALDAHALEILSPDCTEVETERAHQLATERGANLRTLRGSQQRAEHLAKDDWIALITALRASDSQWGSTAADWLVCSRVTGLRPCEWQHASLEGATLKVVNAKATHQRSHGRQRTIDLHMVSKVLLDLLGAFIQFIRQHPGEAFEALYNRARDLIADVGRRTLTKRRRYPTLYTARHMFAASAKASCSKAEVAALMGHASIETAERHYAAARHARNGFPLEVRPDPRDVSTVQQLHAAKLARAFLADQEHRA